MQQPSAVRWDHAIAAPPHWTRERLDSWKEVAQFFRREVRTVQLWEKHEGLPVRRQLHKKSGSVYAYRRELEQWWIARSSIQPGNQAAGAPQERVAPLATNSHPDQPRLLILPFVVTHAPHERSPARGHREQFVKALRENLVTELRQLGVQPVVQPISHPATQPVSPPVRMGSLPETASLSFMTNLAKEFAAGFVVTASLRHLGNRAQLSVQLIPATAATSCWSERYDLAPETTSTGNAQLAVRISRELAHEARQHTPSICRQTPRTSHALAYHACQLGFHFWNQRSKASLRKALAYYQEAIALDPQCGDAYAGLADTYVSLSYNYLLPSQTAASLAEAAVDTAMRLDPHSLRVQNQWLNLLINCTWDWPTAERRSREMIDAGAMDVRTLQLLSSLMSCRGRHDEAISLALHAHRLEPLSDWINGQVALAYFYADDYDNTLLFARQTVELQPHFTMGHALLGRTEIERSNWNQAILALRSGLDLSAGSPCILALLAYAHAAAGDAPQARSMLRDLEDPRSVDCFPAYDVSAVHALLNQEDLALKNIQRAHDTRDMKTIFVHQDPRFKKLRGSASFQQIASVPRAAKCSN